MPNESALNGPRPSQPGRPLQSGTEGVAGVPDQQEAHRSPGGDGALSFREQLEGGDADLPADWPPGETAEAIRGRMTLYRNPRP